MSSADIILHWRNNPRDMVVQLFGVEPDEWQSRAMRDFVTHDRVAIKSGHGVGKTAFLSWTVIGSLLTTTPVLLLCTAPSSSQLENILWAEVARWRERMPEAFRQLIDVQADKIVFTPSPQTNLALARTARKEKPEAFQGFHDANMVFLVDEASGVDELIFETGAGSMSTRGAKTLLTGNPTRTSGFFYDAFHSARSLWKTHTVSCFDAKMVDDGYIEYIATQYGEDSNVYKVRVLGEFPSSDDQTVIPLHMIDSAVGRDVEQVEGKVVWGLDVARFGDDWTALAKRRRNVLLEPVKSWRKKDLMQTTGLVVMEYERTPMHLRPDMILVDSIGVGAGVVDRLAEQGLPVRGINVAESSSVSDRYMRLRDELWWKAREWFQGQDVTMPQDDPLIAELSMPLWEATSAGKIKVESKSEMKLRGRKSPNLADAFNLTFAVSDAALRYRKEYDYVGGETQWLA